MERLLMLAEMWLRYSELKNGFEKVLYSDDFVYCYFSKRGKTKSVYFDYNLEYRQITEASFPYGEKLPIITIAMENNNPEYINNLCSKYEELLKIERGLE